MGSEAIGAIDRQMLWRSDGLAKHTTGDGSPFWISSESQGDRFRAMFLDDVIQFRSNLTQGLVPRYLDPFPFAPFSRTLHGMLDSIRMIEKLIIGEALDAQPASVLRVIRVARDLCDLCRFPYGP